jgi:ABC-type arginine transport system ATPase subunit
MSEAILRPDMTVMQNLVRVAKEGGIAKEEANRRASLLLENEYLARYAQLRPHHLRTETRKKIEKLLSLIVSPQYFLMLQVETTDTAGR